MERIRFVATQTWTTAIHPRSSPLAPVQNDGALLRANDTTATVTWIDHATLLVQLDILNILTNPHWSSRASPVGFAGHKRLVKPGLQFEHLPCIHLVLISHDHYDHLDLQTVRRLAQVHRPLFLAPLGLKKWFEDRQIEHVEELDWWQSRRLEDIVITCTPAQHFSRRTLWNHNRRLWSGWSVQG